MANKYHGIHEFRSKHQLLTFLELLWILDKKRFSRTVLMKQLGVPYSIARAFSQGKGKIANDCYKKLSDAEPSVVEAILVLVEEIEAARRIDKLVDTPVFQGEIYKDTRSKK